MSATAYKQVLVSAIIQIIIGGFCVIFGIIEIITAYDWTYISFTAIICLPIWMGLWIGITGILGVIGKLRGSSKALIGVYMGFSIVSVVFAGIMIICYSFMTAFIQYSRRNYSVQAPYTIGVLILILSIIEFGVGIWSCVCCCVIGPCCGRQQQMAPTGPAMYMQPQGGPAVSYVIVQGPDGTPVAVPAQSGGPMMVPSGTPVNVQGGAVPPHYENAVQSHQNEVKVAL